MGKSRSKILSAYIKETGRRARRFYISIEAPWPCPWHIEHDKQGFVNVDDRTMTFKYDGGSRSNSTCIMIYCTTCKKGEVMPLVNAWQPIDYYHFVIDHEWDGKVPTFVIQREPHRPCTLGTVIIQEVRQIEESHISRPGER